MLLSIRLMSKNTFKKNAETITDFGTRQINKQNFSRTVVLPKTALKNCGCNHDDDCEVNVSLVQNNDERFLKLTPVVPTDEDDEEDDDEDNDDA